MTHTQRSSALPIYHDDLLNLITFYGLGYDIHFHNISAIGCPDLVRQPDTWMQRKGENLVVKCNHSQETWYLTCQSTTWIGEIGNCSRGNVYM